jgi:RNA polymerase sigma factor (sigma-70 family)
MTREELFLSELARIERVIAWVCARRCLRSADAEDFGSAVKLRLIENDYEVLAKFRGRSSLGTYLAAVINRLYLDYQAQRFGKWRPSAEARRLGPLALRLESLLYRDGLTFEEACGVLESEQRASREELHELRLKVPRRNPRRASGEEPEPIEPPEGAASVERAERQALAERTFLAIRRSLQRLPARDRILLRLHIDGGLSVQQVARALGEEPRALYRRKEAALEQLRGGLAAEGIGRQELYELLSALDWDAAIGGEAAAPPGASADAWKGGQ